MATSEPEPGGVDWLDLGPDPDEGRPPRDPRRRYLWYGGAAALVVALLVARSQNGTDRAASAPRSPSATVPSGSAVSSSAVSSSAAAPTAAVDPTTEGSFASPTVLGAIPSNVPVQVSNAGHRLLDVPADWELFARSEGSLLRIQLALGRVTVTALPGTSPDTPAVLLVGADRVIVRPMDESHTPSVVVRDGRPAVELPQSLQKSSWLLPGPDSRHLWAEGGDGGLVLFTLDGRPTRTKIEVPVMGAVVGADSAGYALVSGTGGIYTAKPGAVHRVTSGALVASGPTRWLTIECDDSFTCALVATNRASGARHSLGPTFETNGGIQSTISPDGSTMAAPSSDGGISGDGIALLDIDSGLRRSVSVTQNSINPAGPSLVWSPDSRWLFAVDSGGRIMVVNRATGKAAPLDMELPQVIQLEFRHRTG